MAVTPKGSRPSTRISSVFGFCCKSVCVASTCSTSLVPMPKAKAPKAPWVAVWLSPQTIVMPGWVSPNSGPITWTIPWLAVVEVVEANAELPAVLPQGVDLLLGDRIGDRQAAVGGRHVVVGGGHGPLRPPHLAAGKPQPLEGLGAGHLVDQVQIDVQDRLLALLGMDDVIVPDFLEHRPGGRLCGHAMSRWGRISGQNSFIVSDAGPGKQWIPSAFGSSRITRTPQAAPPMA